MDCPACGHQNPEQAKFCGECAHSLAVSIRCPSCGTDNQRGQKFCNECAHPLEAAAAAKVADEPERAPRDYTPRHLADKILRGRSTLEGERKQVTVLFADVRGSLELSSSVDAEQWHRILDRFFQILSDGVHRFEGTVNQYTGDGIMALFGAPISHEDHAHRACYAALQLREALGHYSDEIRVRDGLDFTVRMGLNSGEVVVGKIGDDLRMDYTAQGQTVGLAARMQQLAAANSVALSAETAQLVEGYFELRSLGDAQVKGVAEPVPVFELQGVGAIRTRLDASRARGFSRFVGRADEMATLEASLDRMLSGEGQVIGVVANAGVGKSRLCLEFAERCRNRGIGVREGHCLAHGRSVPLLPVLEILRDIFDINDGDSARTARNKIAGALLLADRGLEPSVPLVFEMLGVTDPGNPAPDLPDDVRQRRMLDLVRGYIQARSAREPSVIVFEDLHWVDPASEIFIQNLIDVVPNTRSILLVNFRPEYRADFMQRSTYRQIPLRPLGPEEIGELLAELLGPEPELAELSQQIRERTAGNPFFIEELIRSLADTGKLEGVRGAYHLAGPLGTIEIPPAVQPLLASRIDRLTERDKQVLQAAAVLGDEATESVLAEMLDLPTEDLAAALHELVAGEFLQEGALYPEPEYAFIHPLMHDVAYHSQLAERRARLHGRAAKALEARVDESRGESAAILARHWEEAGEKLPAARWHAVAAQRVALTYPAESYRHYGRVRELTDELGDDPEARPLGAMARVQMFSVGARVGIPEAEMAELYRECEVIVEQSGSDEERCQLLTGYAFYRLYVTGNVRDAARSLGETIDLADRIGSLPLRIAARFAMGAVYIATDPQRLVELSDEVLSLLREDPSARSIVLPAGFEPEVGFKFMRISGLNLSGRLTEAEKAVQGFQHLAEEQPEAAGLAKTCEQLVANLMGEFARAEVANAAALEISEASGNLSGLAIALQGRGELLRRRGRLDEALETFERVGAIQREQRAFRQIEPTTIEGIARVYLDRGQLEPAQRQAEAMRLMCTERGLQVFLARAHCLLAEVAIAREGAGARAFVDEALVSAAEIVEQTGSHGNEPLIHEVRAQLARAMDDAAGHRQELRHAQQLYRQIGASGHVQRLSDELAAH